MVLGEPRINRGKSPYDHENEAIDFVIQALPNTEPYHLWALTELFDPQSQRLFEVDAIILGYAALYVVEIKSYSGRIGGNVMDWTWQTPDGRVRLVDSPLSGVNLKAKILASRLRQELPAGQVPWVQELVFLSAADLKVDLTDEARARIVTRATFEKAITRHEFPGADPRKAGRRIDRPSQAAILRALREIGLKERAAATTAGEYTLGRLIGQGVGYRDYEARHRTLKKQRRRARVYLVSSATSAERRAQLRRAADREAQLLSDAGGHPGVLSFSEYIADAPLGPTILFEDFENAQPLDAFVRTHPDLSFTQRVQIVIQVGNALEFCHRRGIFHGAVNPEAVLVRESDKAVFETRLLNFQLGGSDEASVTRHISSLTSETASLFQAPELREGSGNTGTASDVFSFGALAYFVFTGELPARSRAELDQRLQRDRALDPRAVGDDISSEVANLITDATSLSIADRLDSVEFICDTLLDIATSSQEPQQETVDPLTAVKGNKLEGGFEVVSILGHGATARVLEVRYHDKEYALKVSIDSSHDARMGAEAQTLARLNHPRIVQLEHTVSQPLTVAGRSALLMSIVGTETLYKKIQRDGTVLLDIALRYGEDLLDALSQLEDEGITHRDIKPANLGVGMSKSRKGSNHLTLFDFSLSQTPANHIEVGTAAYRDPFLRNRGSWDAAADLWSAAVTLHEMLTGIRPTYGAGRTSALDPQAELCLKSEAFDPLVRNPLDSFFKKALARDANDRYPTAADMRRAWVGCFAAQGAQLPARAEAAAADDTTDVPDSVVAAVKPETLIAALPLSVRAINALDRAGLMHAQDLLQLPENRLSAIRGVGRTVAREVLKFRSNWLRLRTVTAARIEPLLPTYHGPDVALADAGIEPAIVRALADAGIYSTRVTATTDTRQLATIAHKAAFDHTAIKTALERFQQAADEREHPATIEGWLKALLPEKSKSCAFARQLYGLDAPFVGRTDVSGTEVAKAATKTAAAVYLAIQRCGETWQKHPGLAELQIRARVIVEQAGGAILLAKAAALLLADLGHDKSKPQSQLYVETSALLRVVCEVEHDDDDGLVFGRLPGGSAWICSDGGTFDMLRELGKRADELALSYPPAPSSEALAELGRVVSGTDLAKLNPDRLTELAADASRHAARSTRLEIYQRGLDPARAIKLTASVLVGDRLSVDEVSKRVRQRYPEAAALPKRPELDELLRPEGLDWNEAKNAYQRRQAADYRGPDTTYSSISREMTALPAERRSMSLSAIEAREFDEKLRTAVERGRFCALKVLADQTTAAVAALAEQLQVTPLPLDALLLDAAKELASEKRVKLEAMFAADAAGSNGQQWQRLKSLMEDAANRLAAKLLPNSAAPLLLVQAGLVAKYELDEFLARFVQTAGTTDGTKAILLVVPCHDGNGPAAINGQLSIPGLLPSQSFFVPRSWIENQHKKAA